MAALDAADVTIVVTERWIEGTKRYSRGTMAIAGTDTYPTAGVPLPAIAKFGMVRQLDVLQVFGQDAGTTTYVYGYNKAAHKLQIYEEEAAAAGGPLLEADTAEVPGPRTLNFLASGW